MTRTQRSLFILLSFALCVSLGYIALEQYNYRTKHEVRITGAYLRAFVTAYNHSKIPGAKATIDSPDFDGYIVVLGEDTQHYLVGFYPKPEMRATGGSCDFFISKSDFKIASENAMQ